MSAIIHLQAEAVSRLAQLGLEEEPLREAAAKGQLAVDNCTDNHPRMFPPLVGWAETVRGLRDYVATLGWGKSDDRNYALALDPNGRVAIAVATGNEQTGVVSGTPATKASKGPSTLEAVLVNQAQFDLFSDLKAASDAHAQSEEDKRATWILLIHRALGETRVELSLPVAIGADGRVTDWRERIILGSIPRDPQPLRIVPPDQPDLDVQVTRRT